MSMYDWNGDGNKGGADNFMEYQIYKDCNGNSSNYPKKNSSSGNGIWIILIVVAIVGAICEPLGLLILVGYGLVKLFS